MLVRTSSSSESIVCALNPEKDECVPPCPPLRPPSKPSSRAAARLPVSDSEPVPSLPASSSAPLPEPLLATDSRAAGRRPEAVAHIGGSRASVDLVATPLHAPPPDRASTDHSGDRTGDSRGDRRGDLAVPDVVPPSVCTTMAGTCGRALKPPKPVPQRGNDEPSGENASGGVLLLAGLLAVVLGSARESARASSPMVVSMRREGSRLLPEFLRPHCASETAPIGAEMAAAEEESRSGLSAARDAGRRSWLRRLPEAGGSAGGVGAASSLSYPFGDGDCAS
mmetsp:Transcript_38088/g.122463  ORF Transcript_38088/g.122463 Transcript_38088/m.122463 type:complete len:281 (+) Transcript_38088:653-1495(+)